MTTDQPYAETRKLSGIAGLLYLSVVVTGAFALLYVPSQLFVTNDAAATTQNIANAMPLFQLSIVAGMICYVSFLVLPLALYKLLSHAHRDAAVLMVLFAVASVPISLLNLGHKFDIVSIVGGAGASPTVLTTQMQTQVMQALDSYGSGVLIAELFWGLWLFPFGYLAFRSGTIPRFLGVSLMLGCVGYLINVVCTVLIEGYAERRIASVLGVPSAIGEIGTCLWLLLVGTRAPRADALKGPEILIRNP
jgi:hypothetical protein